MQPTLFNALFTGFLLVIVNQTSSFTIRPKLNCTGIPVDIVFVLDSSSSIWGPHFQKQLEFVSYMVNQTDIGLGPQQVRVGVEIFANKAHVKLNLHESTNKVELNKKISRISRVTGDTNTADALNKLREIMFQTEQGSRPGVKRVAIILTDGASTDEAATQVAAKACRDEHIQLFAVGIGHSISLSELMGIASKPTEKFLIRTQNYDALNQIRETIVQRTCYAVVSTQPTTTATTTATTTTPTTTTTTTPNLTTSSGLPTTTTATTPTPATTPTQSPPSTTVQTSSILPTRPSTTRGTTTASIPPSTTTTPVTTTKPVTTTTVASSTTIPTVRPTTDWLKPADEGRNERACKSKTADVYFLLDSSSSIRIDEFKKQRNAIEDIVHHFDIGAKKTRVGLSLFSHKYKPVLGFDSGSDKSKALQIIRKINYMGGGTKTGQALHQVRSHVFNPASIRVGAERILIVFTDGMSIDYDRTSAEAKLLQESGVKIFVVGIGPDVDQMELEDIASKPSAEFVHTFASFDILRTESDLLTYKVCTVRDQTFVKDQNACDAAQVTDVAFMVSSNRFGREKTDRILKASAEVINKVGSHRTFRYGTIFDDCSLNQDLAVGTVTDQSQLTNEMVEFKYSSLSSFLGKLEPGVFPRKSRNSRQVGLLFLDNTIDLNDPQILAQARRAYFQDIELYVVIIGDGVDRSRVQRVLAPRERIINVNSYETLTSYLPLMFAKRFCVPYQRDESIRPGLA